MVLAWIKANWVTMLISGIGQTAIGSVGTWVFKHVVDDPLISDLSIVVLWFVVLIGGIVLVSRATRQPILTAMPLVEAATESTTTTANAAPPAVAPEAPADHDVIRDIRDWLWGGGWGAVPAQPAGIPIFTAIGPRNENMIIEVREDRVRVTGAMRVAEEHQRGIANLEPAERGRLLQDMRLELNRLDGVAYADVGEPLTMPRVDCDIPLRDLSRKSLNDAIVLCRKGQVVIRQMVRRAVGEPN